MKINVPTKILEIRQNQLDNARIFHNRYSIFNELTKFTHMKAIEIGVLGGDYIDEMLKVVNPQELFLIDTFNCDDVLNFENPRFTKENHYNFILNKYKEKENIKVVHGFSQHVLPDILNNNINPYINHKFDYIHIDGDHIFRSVYVDLLLSSQLISDDGYIGCDDYNINQDLNDDKVYGVREAVNLFLFHNENFEVKFFTFHINGFYSIYIGKKEKDKK